MSKACTKCGDVKPLSEFYRRSDSRGGFMSQCKNCYKKRCRIYQRTPTALLAGQQRSKKRREEKWEDTLAYKRRYIRENQEKVRCRGKTVYLVATGKLVRQPCEHCGAEPGEAHHPDYSCPELVIWLCKVCHAAEHRIYDDG